MVPHSMRSLRCPTCNDAYPRAVALRDGVSSFLADTARRLLAPALQPASAPVVRQDGTRQDCGPAGCGAPPWADTGDLYGLPGYEGAIIGLSREQVDAAMVETLLNTVVVKIVEDALREPPTLAGDRLGELTDCVSYLAERGWNEAHEQALCYERAYGGGGVVCIIDDGRPPDLEVDPNCIRGIEGFFALSTWNLIPADIGSPRVRAGWYGQRFGRPEHYFVTPDQPLRGMPDTASGTAARELLRAGGSKWHRSRIVPCQHRDKMDARTARAVANWRGWGPGVVEGCLASYLARRAGALHTNEVLRASHFNVLTTPNVAHSQATPTGSSALDNALDWVRWCLAKTRMGSGIPIVAVDPSSKMEAISHTLSGIADILREQRQFFLDNVPEYPEVVLMPGSGNSGMSGDGKEGEWQAYDANVMAFRQSKVWTGGAFGGGMRQAAIGAMMAKDGPTRGQVDMTVRPSWAPTRRGTAASLATARKANSEARAIDKVVLGLTPQAFLRHEPGLAGEPGAQYPSLDVAQAPIPQVPPSDGQALALPTPGAAPAPAATTPAAAVSALTTPPKPTADEAPDFVAEPMNPAALQASVAASFPADIATEKQLAAALLMTPGAFQKWVADHPEIKRYPVPPGTRGGARYSLGEVLAAFNASASAKVDSLRDQP